MFVKVLLCVSLAVLLVAGEDCVQQECPKIGAAPGVVQIPNVHNCSMYISCSNGQAIDMSCPPDLHFNPVLLVCDFDWSANCEECDWE